MFTREELKKSGLDFVSRTVSLTIGVFLGVFVALLLLAILTRVYVAWEIDRTRAEVQRAGQEFDRTMKNAFDQEMRNSLRGKK